MPYTAPQWTCRVVGAGQGKTPHSQSSLEFKRRCLYEVRMTWDIIADHEEGINTGHGYAYINASHDQTMAVSYEHDRSLET